ncbi:hypothetical protein BDV98DRAFT_481670, partial [Pterulicium gracile]
DQLIATVIPRVGVERDGYTECIIPNIVRKRILTTPGFPAPVPRSAVDPVYKIVQVPGKGLGMAATRDIEARGLVLAERPLKITPMALRCYNMAKKEGLTNNDFMIVELQESERFLEKFSFSLMDAGKKKAFFALHNAHTKDGSGPIVGRLRTNGFGIPELKDALDGEDRDDLAKTLKGTCEVGSRFNHICEPNSTWEFDVRAFSFLFFTTRDVKAGEELTVTYCALSIPTAERNKALDPYAFKCTCPRCLDPSSSDKTTTTLSAILRATTAALLQNHRSAESVLQMALRCYDMAEKEGLKNDERFLASVELVVVVYQMIGDLENAVTY